METMWLQESWDWCVPPIEACKTVKISLINIYSNVCLTLLH